MSVEITCPQCGYSKQVPEEKIPPRARWANCPRCKNRFELHLQPSALGEQPDSSQEEGPSAKSRGSDWEARSELGIWKGLYRTTRTVLFSPRRFFSGKGIGSGLADPFAFGLLSGVAGVMGWLFWLFLILSGSLRALGQLEPTGISLLFAAALVLSIPFVGAGLLLCSLVLHGCLVAVKDGSKGFESTFRVVAYSQAAQIFSFIPFVGGAAAFIWLFVVQVIGLREIHSTTISRIILAYVIPFVLLVGIVSAVVAFLSYRFLH